jgi:glycosyltransferase involved in cell wall biosynthesis
MIRDTIIIVPAFNEEANMACLMAEIHASMPGTEVLVINDGSVDRTAEVAHAHGAIVLDLPCNLGVGGAVQAGFAYAYERGYQYVVRCDGDGQHPPSEIPKLLAVMMREKPDLVIGSRFLADRSYTSTFVRSCGISVLARLLSLICRKRVTDPTSGFQVVRRPLLYFFSKAYPVDYPEPEALALLRREGYDFVEVSAIFRERKTGQSTIKGWGPLYYVIKVFMALLVDRARPVDMRYSRSYLEGKV